METLVPIESFRSYHLIGYFRLIHGYTNYLVDQAQTTQSLPQAITDSFQFVQDAKSSLPNLHRKMGDELFRRMLIGFINNYNVMDTYGSTTPTTVVRSEMIGLDQSENDEFIKSGVDFLKRVFETPDDNWINITMEPDEWCKVSCIFRQNNTLPTACTMEGNEMKALDQKSIERLLKLSNTKKWKDYIQVTRTEAEPVISIKAQLLKNYNFLEKLIA